MLKELDLKLWKRFALALRYDYNLSNKQFFFYCPEAYL